MEEICKEMEKCNLNLLAVTQTTLRGSINEYYKDYRMVGKGREKFCKQGGGVGQKNSLHIQGGDLVTS